MHNSSATLNILENTLLRREEGRRRLVCSPGCFTALCQVLPDDSPRFFNASCLGPISPPLAEKLTAGAC